MKAKQSFKGIPKEHHAAVHRYMALCHEHVTKGMFGAHARDPQAAYESLKAGWKEQAERKAKEQAERDALQASFKRENVEQAKDTLRTFPSPLVKLGFARDYLSRIVEQNGDEVENALIARALLLEAGAQMEEALLTLGVITTEQGSSGTFLSEQEYQAHDTK